MAVSLEFRDAGVIIWSWGVLSGEEMLQSNAAVYRHEFPGAFIFQLAVLSCVTELDVTPDQMRLLAAMDSERVVELPQVGIVVAESDYTYGMFRMWNMQAESEMFATKVVRNMDEALSVLASYEVILDNLAYPAESRVHHT